jgi:glycerate dehydrogenase
VDVDAARAEKIIVTNVPTYGTASVAQMVFAHILNLTQHVAEHAAGVRDGCWSRSRDFCYWDFPLTELDGLTMGIVGLGRIGRATARLAHAFGMQILAHDVAPPGDVPQGTRCVDLDLVLRDSDVVSLHCPLTPQTERLIDRGRLAAMKPTAFLINTSRGALIDEPALADALERGVIAGAGLDVLCLEPPEHDNPLLAAKNCFVTPHIAWATKAARQRLMDVAVANVRAYLEDRPQNVVNG